MVSSFTPSFERFSPAADLTVVAVSIVMIALMLFSYVSRRRSLRIFLSVIGVLVFAALADVSWNMIFQGRYENLYPLGYGLRVVYHALLYVTFFLYVFYITEVTGLEPGRQRVAVAASAGTAAVFIAAEALIAASPAGFRILADGSAQTGFNIFIIGYLVFSAGVFSLLWRIRGYLYRKVIFGFCSSIAVAYGMMIVQQFFRQASFTVSTFFFPTVAMFYIVHSTPYNVALGAVDSQAFHDMVRSLYGRKAHFGFISLYLPELDADGASLPEELQSVVRRFATDYFRGANLFQIHTGHVLLLFRKKRNPDFEHRTENILRAFKWEHAYFQYDYKVVIGEDIDEISASNEYAGLIRSIHRNMKDNTVHRVSPDDIRLYRRDMYILGQLADICDREDPDDPRVLAYCQPVYSIRAGQFRTAEALMRLLLPETGLVFPDQFIPLAEENGYIHTLTKIILHKTCAAVRGLIREGYALDRVSVNVSALELRDDAFCDDITRVIRSADIPGEKIAVELTESRNEEDYLLLKSRIEALRSNGIQLYLDDFGTGYTNLERIVALPFDIIKFDRSMVVASGTDERAWQLLENLAATFAEMGYAILFEGVEDEADETRCRGMSASYLQGYKYSRPVPIGRLKEFLAKA